MTDRDRMEQAWLEGEVRRAAALTDADRIRILRDLCRTAEAIRRTKSADELEREEETRRALDAPGRARYIATFERLQRETP